MKVFPTYPLLGKELMEQAARRRTYIVRVIYAALLFVVFSIMYARLSGQDAQRLLLMLGSGRILFEGLVGLQFAGIFLFLPAMVCGVITYEKERQSLPLLILTGMSPWRILEEKFLGRLIPMGTFLLTSLPLMAICYALGGVEPERFAEALYLLGLACLQAGLFALMCSAWCRTTVGAFITTYVLGTLFYTALPLANEMLRDEYYRVPLPEAESWFLMPAYQFFESQTSLFGGMAARSEIDILVHSLPILVSIVCFALMARVGLLRRAFVMPKNRALQLFRFLDRWMHELNQRVGGIALAKERSLPEVEPVAWRETTRRLLGAPQYLVRWGVLVEFPLLLICLWIYGARAGRLQIDEYSVIVAAIGGLAVLAVIVKAANAIASERVHGTLDVLLTTPLEGADILRQKMRGVTRLSLAFAVPLLTVALFEALSEFHVYNPYDPRDEIDPISYLVGIALSVAVYLPMFAWGSLWVALRTGSRTHAILLALVLAVAWMVLPPIAWAVLVELSEGGQRGPMVYMLLLSPATLPICLEMNETRMFGFFPPFVIAMNFALYLYVWRRLKRTCLQHADRLLGRATVIA